MSTSLLPASVSSSEDLLSLIMEIRTYAKWFTQVNNAQKTGVALKLAQPELTTTAIEIIRARAKDGKMTAQNLDSLVAELEAVHTRAKSLTITLAAPAPNDVKHEIVTWARENISDDTLINFRFNSQIVGGMVVRAGSQVFDWSFKKTIIEHKAQLVETLARV